MIARYINYNNHAYVQKGSVVVDENIYYLYNHSKADKFPADTSLVVNSNGKVIFDTVETLEDVKLAVSGYLKEIIPTLSIHNQQIKEKVQALQIGQSFSFVFGKDTVSITALEQEKFSIFKNEQAVIENAAQEEILNKMEWFARTAEINGDIVQQQQNERLVLSITGKTKQEFNEEVSAVFEKGVKEVYTSEKWQQWLEFCSSFYQYSSKNRFLIFSQMPFATHVASMKDWNEKYNRHVIKGQGAQGLKVYAPTKFKRQENILEKDEKGFLKRDENGEILTSKKTVETQGFILVSVYDISQTEGEPVPQLTEELKGNYKDARKVITALEKIAKCPISFEPIEGAVKGYFSESLSGEKRIVIKENMPDEQTIKTAVHETAHAVLHSRKENGYKKVSKMSSQLKELQAESVAFCVCKHLGIDTSQYSFPYLASWSRGQEPTVLKETLDVVVSTSDDFIKKLDVLMLRLNLQKCENRALIEEYLQNSEYLNEEKSSYNQKSMDEKIVTLDANIEKMERYGSSPMVEICWSESGFFQSGQLFTLDEIDAVFEKIDADTKLNFSKLGYENCYSKVMFQVYIPDKSPDLETGKKYATHIRERYDFGDCTHKSLTHFLTSTNKTHEMMLREHTAEQSKKHSH